MPTVSVPACLRAALYYLRLGWSPLALCPPDHAMVGDRHKTLCESPGKSPCGSFTRWAEFQHRRASEEELEAAWRANRKANVGVVMGQISGLIGIDIDGIIGSEMLDDLSKGDLPKTLQFNTGRDDSFRLLYALPEGSPTPRIIPFRVEGVGEPLKIMGEGSQSVMPPSLHKDGGTYQWCEGQGPHEMEISPAPKWLLEMIADEARAKTPGSESRDRSALAEGAKILEGGRDSTLAAMAGAVRRFGCTETELLALLRSVNERCSPKLPDAQVVKIAHSVARYRPAEVPSTPDLKKKASAPSSALVSRLDEVEEKDVHWLWNDRLPFGALVCLDGDGGTGKSSALIDIAARLTRGEAMPDGTRSPHIDGPANVLIVSCEDGLETIVKPRARIAGADLTRVFHIEEVADKFGEVQLARFPEDCSAIEEVVRKNDIKFVVVDPILAFLGSTDYASDPEVRKALNPLKHIAESHGCCVVFVRHWNKGSMGAKASYRGGGSLAFINLGRMAFTVGHHPEEDDVSVMAFTKGNWGPKTPPLAFRLVPELPAICRVEWLGEAKGLDAESITKAPESKEERESLAEAVEWLEDLLRDEAQPVSLIRLTAKKLGFTQGQVQRAKTKLGVRAERSAKGKSEWTWSLTKG